jgi:ABC-type branched-subunit amino acid transport system substrate-binding protein
VTRLAHTSAFESGFHDLALESALGRERSAKDMEWRAATYMIQLICALALASLFCLPGLAQPLKHDPDSSVKDSSDTPIRIGALLPFSGGVELYGEQAKLGIDLAAQEINSKGGILGHPLQVIYADDGTRPQIALNGVNKLIEEDNVLAIIGPITSQNLNAVAPTMLVKKTPLLYAKGGSPVVTSSH